jgi:lincosamide nucleotidyltransferase A/C/D/E
MTGMGEQRLAGGNAGGTQSWPKPRLELMQDKAASGTALQEVLAVLDALASAGCKVWVTGGWGVDALVGRQTRTHRDLDLAVDARHTAIAIQTLEGRGYSVETEWRPVRVELAAEGKGWVDLHPVVFDDSGHGRQADLDGGYFDYSADAFGHGLLGCVRVACLSRDQQLRFHSGYPPRPIDLHDLELLRPSAPND